MKLPLRGVNGRLLQPPPPFACTPVENAAQQAQSEAPTIRPGNRPERRSDGAGTTSAFIVAAGLAISGVAHLVFLTPAVIFDGTPYDTPPTAAITVDLVSPDQVPQSAGESPSAETPKEPEAPKEQQETPPKEESPAEKQQPAPTADAPPPPPALPVSPPTPEPSAMPPSAMPPSVTVPRSVLPPPPFMTAQPPPEPSQSSAPDDSNAPAMFAMPMTMPDGTVGGRTFDRQGVDQSDITKDAASTFFDHLRTCAKRPGAIPPGVRVVVRVYLNPDGTLASGLPANPAPLKVSMGGGELFVSAVAALRKCQPYKMLPPDQYPEWRMLDLTFTAQNF